jgi:membrane-bound acyltransferase YfiQ involved in biofilm formation
MLLYKLNVFAGIVCAWYCCGALVRWCMARPWFVGLTSFSFIIYGLHVPIVTYTIDALLQATQGIAYNRLLCFFLLPLLLVTFCIGIGWLLKKLVPSVYALLKGGRGL